MQRFSTIALACLIALPTFAQDVPPAKPTDADAKIKTDAYNQAVKDKSDEGKKAAIDAMSDCPHANVLNLLARILVGDTDECRTAAAKTLGRMKGELGAAKALHGALKANEERSSVLTACFTAIGDINHPSSVAVCEDWVNHRLGSRDGEDLPGVNQAVDALGALKWKSSVEALIDLWHKNRVVGRDPASKFREKVRKHCSQALSRLVGEKVGNQDAWDDWWKDNKGKFNDDLTSK
ncbi:MAG: hypothetical protein FD180_4123 [Planctomycetota bacterium]|nr:MAG: hypothetical protein FD180_4123 [Planctomycetota bacterium]